MGRLAGSESTGTPARLVWACLLAGATAVLGAGTASAAFPGQNGKIAFRSSGGDYDVETIESDGQNRVPLTGDATLDDFEPHFSPDGERIVFTHHDGADNEIYIMDADGQNVIPATNNSVNDSWPAFSPDGRKIVFVRFVGGDYEIYVMDADGQNQVPLTDNAVEDIEPTFSPDGQRIVFARGSFAVPQDFDIFAMNADGQSQVALTQTAGVIDRSPDVSPDGSRIVFGRIEGSDSDIIAMAPDGGSQVPLANDPSLGEFEPAFSPDGQRIAFVRSASGNNGISVMDATGQNPVALTFGGGSEPDWQPLNPPALDLSGRAKQKSVKTIPVTVVSQNEDATVTLGGTVSAPKPKKRAAASKSKAFDLPPQTVELQPGQPVVVELAVPGKARKLLKNAFAAGKKGTAAITATATDDLGASSEDSHAVKLKKKQKK